MGDGRTSGLVLAVGILLVMFALGTLFAIPGWTARRWREGEGRWLRALPVSELAAEVAKSMGMAGWDRLPQGAALRVAKTWTEKSSFSTHWMNLVNADRRGRGKGAIRLRLELLHFYDAGLAAVCQALRDRLGIPQPWDKKVTEPVSS